MSLDPLDLANMELAVVEQLTGRPGAQDRIVVHAQVAMAAALVSIARDVRTSIETTDSRLSVLKGLASALTARPGDEPEATGVPFDA